MADDRAELILRGSDIDRLVGLEIGPLDKPLVKRTGNRDIFYADYASRPILQDKSRSDQNVNVDMIPEIDYIISPLPGDLGRGFDYIVASHVGEHVPDLIGWLRTLGQWLLPGGQLVLALPDKRFTFDCTRELSTAGQLIEAYLERRQRPSVASIYDGFSKALRVEPWYLWEMQEPPQPFPNMFSREVSLALAKESYESGIYRDCHCWVFTASSFKQIMEELRLLGLFDFECVRFVEPSRYICEFYVNLRPNPVR